MSLISQKLLKPRPTELGKIKIGGLGDVRQSQGGRPYRLPVKYDHFIVTTRDRERAPQQGVDGDFVKDEAIHASLGSETPTELPGILMFETPEENFHAEMVQYQGRTKIVSCNGEERTDIRAATSMACPRLKDPEHKCGCKPYSRLTIQLWAAPVGGYHVFRTTSWESTNNIQSALVDFHERFGSLYHLPVKLVVYPAQVKYTEGNTEKTSQAYMVGLVLGASMEEAARQMVNAGRMITATRSELKRLAGDVQEEQTERDREEATLIAQEYFPEDGIQASVKSREKLDDLKDALSTPEDEGPVVEAEFEFEEEAPAGEKAEAGSVDEEPVDPDVDGGTDAGVTEDPPAEADPDPKVAERLRFELADLMEEHAPHLLTKAPRVKWTKRLVGKSTPNHCSEFELRQLIEAVKNGDTGPEAQSTPFDEEEEEASDQAEMPV